MKIFAVGEKVIFISEDDIPESTRGYFQLIEFLNNLRTKYGNGPFPIKEARDSGNPQRASHPQEIVVETSIGEWGANGFWFKKYKF